MKLKKDGTEKKSGGARSNAGKKTKSEVANYHSFSFRPSMEVRAILDKQKNKTLFVELAILAYNLTLDGDPL
jgi:hypothetical protein